MKKAKKCLLIDKLIQEGWFSSEKEAIPWVMARKVLVNDQPAASCKEKVAIDSVIRVKEYYKKKYVNKGGFKLEGALKDFSLNVEGKIALDCGASTGGFTDCLIVNGAQKVYAVDVGYGQLAGKLAIHPNVVSLEKTNLSDPILCTLDPTPEIITLDLSYLSLEDALPICKDIFKGQPGIVVCLVKPIYEVESSEIRRNGKINDPDVLREVLQNLCNKFIDKKASICGITNSPITGNSGTLEYFIEVELNGNSMPPVEDMDKSMEDAIERSFQLAKFKKSDYTLSDLDKKYVTRSGLKLEKAIEVFPLDVNEKVCIDIGASEGGFTDCLLQNNAKKVYAVDVAYGIFDWKLRNNDKVVVLERTNARYLSEDKVPEKCDVITIDVAFISITKILPNVRKLLKDDGSIMALFKPQFELSKEHLKKNGNIDNPEHIVSKCVEIISFLKENQIFIRECQASPIHGNNGNIEFLLYGDINLDDISTVDEETLTKIIFEAFSM